MKSSDLAEWAQAASGIVLLLVTYIYTRISTRILASQVAPYLAVQIWSKPGPSLQLSITNAGRGPALDVRGFLLLKPWYGTLGDEIRIEFQAPIVDVHQVIAIPTPRAPNGELFTQEQAYERFEYVAIDAMCKDQRNRPVRRQWQYRIGRVLWASDPSEFPASS
jgi:hypothetical protein